MGLLSGLVSSAGSLAYGAASNYISGKINDYFNRKGEDRQKDWERERAQNAHQWEVNDLKAAGLNPILSTNAGATTGGIGSGGVDLTATGNTALAHQNYKLAMEKQKADIKNAKALTAAQVERSKAETERIKKTTPEEVKNLQWQRKSRLEKELGEATSQGIVNTAQKAGKWAGSPSMTEEELDKFYRRKYTRPKGIDKGLIIIPKD